MGNVPTLDLSNLSTVDTVYRRKAGQPYDLSFSQATEKFRISNDAFDKLGLNGSGFKMKLHPSGNVLLALVEEDKATMYSRRMSNGQPMDKGKEATNRQLASALGDQFGRITIKDNDGNDKETLKVTKYALVPQGDVDGIPHFLVFPWEDGQSTDLTYKSRGTATSTETAKEEAPATPAAAPAAEAPAAAAAPAATETATASAPEIDLSETDDTLDDLDFGDDEAEAPVAEAPATEKDPFEV